MGLHEDNQQLRKLSRAVMRGELERSEYQSERRRLVDSYTGETGAVDDVDATDPGTAAAVVMPNDATVPSQPRRPAQTAEDVPARKSGDGSMPVHDVMLGLLAVLAVIGLVAGLLAWLW